MIKIAIDTGGTFTDYTAVGSIVNQKNQQIMFKNPTNHQNPAQGVLAGLEELAIRSGIEFRQLLEQTEKITLGTTLALNALLEKKGAKTALFTTAGFRDALEIRRAQLKNQWDLAIETPEVLVPRRLRLGIEERLDYRGKILKPLNKEKVRAACQICRDQGVEAIAVSYLFSFLNPLHEEQTAQIIKAECPDVFISLSSQVAPRIREYERTSTTVINAYCTPVLSDYLLALKDQLATYGYDRPIYIMKNSGGLSESGTMEKFGVQTLLSGPAGGAIGNQALGKTLNRNHTVLADMGGTSFDLHVISGDHHPLVPQTELAGYPITVPMIDIHSIGAGGGSIVQLEAGGRVQIGPASAGAIPGPAGYNLGGEEATLTDALLVLGLINAQNFLAGKLSLSLEKAIEAIDKKIANPLNLPTSEAARMIYCITTEMMADAMRLVTSQKGNDPRIYSLIMAGGAFGLFAARIMESLQMKEVLIPVQGPVFCSFGMLGAACRVDINRSILMEKINWDLEKLNQVVQKMKAAGAKQLDAFGIEKIDQHYRLSLEMRYVGQHHEINVPWSLLDFNEKSLEQVEEGFYDRHQAIYEYAQRDKDWEIINLHLACFEKDPETELFPIEDTAIKRREKWLLGELFGLQGEILVPVYQADNLKDDLAGPALIDFNYTTVLLPQNFICHLEDEGVLVLRRENQDELKNRSNH